MQHERLTEDAPLVAVRRGGLVENVHRGRVAVCDPEEGIVEAVGEAGGYAYARSSAKPFQAIPLVHSGAADALGLTDEELAVACASHSAETPHLAAVHS
ncbi:MAG: asparaginase, partial [Actinobacteria bacterium]|nr:asparaginase [Actinomycetota bacterium]